MIGQGYIDVVTVAGGMYDVGSLVRARAASQRTGVVPLAALFLVYMIDSLLKKDSESTTTQLKFVLK